jgi:cell wall-associated NlpC family hydrolase
MELESDRYLLKLWPATAVCWDLVRQVYRDKFCEDLGTACELDMRDWQVISFDQLKIGDVVLFRDPPFRKHVGVHLSDTAFLHLVEGVGVSVARYRDPVWRLNYLKAYRWKKSDK